MVHSKFSKTLLGATVAGMAMFASTSYGAAMDSIADSWHNLGSLNKKSATPSGNTPANHSNATAEICVFCHTPHGGDTSAAVPLWNRKLNAATNYKRYGSLGSSTFDAEEDDIGSVTIACLSCHDGGQAIDSVINAPGSGGFVNKDNFTYGNMPRLGGGNMVGGDLNTSSGMLLTPAQGIVQNLETDLSNDHPVSMQYAGGGITANGGAWSGTANDADFTGSGKKTHPGQSTAGGTVTVTAMATLSNNANAKFANYFWLERSDSLIPNKRDREDIIFYTRNYKGQEQPFVECGSCHDPHNVDNPTFLRTSNGIPTTLANDFPLAQNDAASGLCLTCHIK
jgi:hypothetical protein